jgi:hypothetical protein
MSLTTASKILLAVASIDVKKTEVNEIATTRKSSGAQIASALSARFRYWTLDSFTGVVQSIDFRLALFLIIITEMAHMMKPTIKHQNEIMEPMISDDFISMSFVLQEVESLQYSTKEVRPAKLK